jgi:Tol biopolymer transport system component
VITRVLSLLAAAAGSLVFAVSSDASMSGVNGRIVFSRFSLDTHTSQLYSAAADGSDLLPLTWPGTNDGAPAASPDGSQIAFLRVSSGGLSRVWLMSTDGSNQRQLTPDDTTGGDVFRPAWSPDGTRLAFTSIRASGCCHIWLINVGGSNLHELSGTFGAWPAWSPDGTRIAYLNATGLYVAQVDGSGGEQITANSADFAPDWSPDGSAIVFHRRNATQTDLYTVAPDGSNLRQLTTVGDASFPSWSPDGTKVVFEEGQTFPEVLSVINADGSGLTTLGGTPFIYGEVPFWAATTVRPRVDSRPPTIAVHTPFDGTIYSMGSTVTVDYTCTDDISGVASCSGTLGEGAALDTSHAGSYSFTVTARDNAGNVNSNTVTYTVADRTPPTITITTPSDGTAYTLGATATADYRCADEAGGSGLRSCQATPIDTTSIGTKTFTVTASDNAGNSVTASRSYSVIYPFDGFYAPTNPYPTPTSANAGQSVKLRFSLGGYQGLDALATGSSVWTTCDGGNPTPGSGTLTYQTTFGRYAYEATTQKSWAGTCRDLVLTLKDGTTHKARFQFE